MDKLIMDLEKLLKEKTKIIEKKVNVFINGIIKKVLDELEFSTELSLVNEVKITSSNAEEWMYRRAIQKLTIIELWRRGYVDKRKTNLQKLLDEINDDIFGKKH